VMVGAFCTSEITSHPTSPPVTPGGTGGACRDTYEIIATIYAGTESTAAATPQQTLRSTTVNIEEG
jgi:hypothetical protein